MPEPEEAAAVVRIFDLYFRGNLTLDRLADRLMVEGYRFRPSTARFGKTTLSYILNNRFYLGEIV